MGLLGAIGGALNSIVGGGPNDKQRLAQEWAKLAKQARSPEAQDLYSRAAQSLWDGHGQHAQKVFDQAAQAERAYVPPPKQHKSPGPAVGAMPIVPPGGATSDDDVTAYREAYQAALAQSQANIEAQYGAALSEISQREGMANQAVDAMPANLNAIYAPAQEAVKGASDAIYQAQQKSGLTPFLPEGAESAPIQAALSGALASRQAGVPELRLSVGGEISKQRQAAEMDKSNALADLASQRAQYETNLQEMLLRRKWDVEDQQAKDDSPDTFGTGEVAGERADWMIQNDPGTVNAIRSGQGGKASTVYLKVLNDLQQNPPQGKGGSIKEKLIIARLREWTKKHPHQAAAISLALKDSGITRFVPSE